MSIKQYLPSSEFTEVIARTIDNAMRSKKEAAFSDDIERDVFSSCEDPEMEYISSVVTFQFRHDTDVVMRFELEEAYDAIWEKSEYSFTVHIEVEGRRIDWTDQWTLTTVHSFVEEVNRLHNGGKGYDRKVVEPFSNALTAIEWGMGTC